jgi:hypothetical protein
MIRFIGTSLQLQQLTIDDCLRLALFHTGQRVSFLLRDWLGPDLWVTHFFSFRCPLVNTPQLNTELPYHSLTNASIFVRVAAFIVSGLHGNIGCLFISMEMFVDSVAVLWFSIVYSFHLCIHGNVCCLSIVTDTCFLSCWLVVDFLYDSTILAFRHHVTKF